MFYTQHTNRPMPYTIPAPPADVSSDSLADFDLGTDRAPVPTVDPGDIFGLRPGPRPQRKAVDLHGTTDVGRIYL